MYALLFYTFHLRADNAVTIVYKPPNTIVTLFGKAAKIKLKVVSGKTQWFKGQISNYDGLTGKYGTYFPCDGENVYVYPNYKDMRFANCVTGIIVILFHQYNELLCVHIYYRMHCIT